MTKEELKALGLTDEQVTKISEDYGKNYVAKSQFNEKNEALKNAEKEKGGFCICDYSVGREKSV